MERIRNLRELLIDQIQDLYNADKQQINTYPEFESKLSSDLLQGRLRQLIENKEKQKDRVVEVFGKLELSPSESKCHGIEGILKETRELINKSDSPEVLDAAIITSLQRANHYLIAGYGSVCTYAKELGYDEVAGILHECLENEKEIDRNLVELAKKHVNEKAIAV